MLGYGASDEASSCSGNLRLDDPAADVTEFEGHSRVVVTGRERVQGSKWVMGATRDIPETTA